MATVLFDPKLVIKVDQPDHDHTNSRQWRWDEKGDRSPWARLFSPADPQSVVWDTR
jgi:hypothetical protein